MRDHEALRHLLLRVLAERGDEPAAALARSLTVGPKASGAFPLTWEGGAGELPVGDFALYPRGDTAKARERRDPEAAARNQARAEAWALAVLGPVGAGAAVAAASAEEEPYGDVLGVLLGIGWFLGWAAPGGIVPALGLAAIVGVARRLQLPALPLLGTAAPWLGVLTVTGPAEGLAHLPAACVSLAVLFWATWEGCRHRSGLALVGVFLGLAAHGGGLAAFFAVSFLVGGLVLPRRPGSLVDLGVVMAGGAAGLASPALGSASATVPSALVGLGVFAALGSLLMTLPYLLAGRHRLVAPLAVTPWLALWAMARSGSLTGLVLAAAALSWALSLALRTGREYLSMAGLARGAPWLGAAWASVAAILGAL